MQQDETTIALDELENRLERLRITYDQYFTGIEKMAPSVQHKDVERRIQVFRKMQIRNSGHRFRFQTLVQRYTTYLQYWQRILRKIEEGTHKRDLARAARYGAPSKSKQSNGRVHELDPDALEEVSDYEEVDEVEPETLRPAAPSGNSAAAVTVAKAQPAPVIATPATAVVPASAATRPAAAPVQSGGFFDAATRQVETMPSFDIVETVKAPRQPTATPTPSAPVAAPTPAPVASPAAPAPAAQRPRVGISVFGAPTQKSQGSSNSPVNPQPSSPSPVARPATAPAATPAATPRPAPVAAPAPTPTPAVARPQPAASAAPDNALQNLYARYRDSRKSTGEGDVAFDTLAKQVNDTLPRLREKYPGAHVEIDVAIKDGKTILRPVVRSKKP